MTRKCFLIGLVSLCMLLVAALVVPMPIRAATSPQVCTVGASCSIGEFLYDDSYVPITTATCTLTSRNPDGTVYINGQALTSTADGWYAHQFTAPTTEGVYRSQICCTTGSDYLCIDKSFDVKASTQLTENDVADAVWNASRTSYTTAGSFGEAIQNIMPAAADIASAVWGYSARTLSSLGTLAADIWGYSARTITGASLDSGSLATQNDAKTTQSKVDDVKGEVSGIKSTLSDIKTQTDNIDDLETSVTNNTNSVTNITNNSIQDIQKTTRETRILLEKQVNKPIIESVILDEPDLHSKLNITKETAKNMYFSALQSQKTIKKLRSSWTTITIDKKLEQIDSIITLLGEPSDPSQKKTLFGMSKWFSDQWDFTTTQTTAKQVVQLHSQLTQIQRQLVSRKTQTVYFPLQIIRTSDLLSTGIGEIGDEDPQISLFSEINTTVQLAGDFDSYAKDITRIQDDWKTMSTATKQKTIAKLRRDIMALNRIPQANSIVNPSSQLKSDKDIQNAVLSLKGLLRANQHYLAQKANKSFASTWLELGSIVFKTLVTNPSTIIFQTAQVKYYLPKEVKKEAIMEIDDGLTLKLDSEKGQYYVAGDFELKAGESRTLSVRVTDIWEVADQELQSLKTQAEALAKTLEKTSYFAQGVTLKSDIDVTLDKIKLRQSRAETPESQIQTYREAEIELAGIQTKMDKLKELATQASSTGTIFGFVGATQTLAVWGLIIIISTGFILLTFYMRKLSEDEAVKKPKKKETKQLIAKEQTGKFLGFRPRIIFLTIVAALVYGLGIAIVSAFVTNRIIVKAPPVSAEEQVLGSRVEPTKTLCEPTAQPPQPQIYLTINDTPTGWLRVRKTPGGGELTRVDVGKSYRFVEKDGSWLKIQLEDGQFGWVSEDYVTIDDNRESNSE